MKKLFFLFFAFLFAKENNAQVPAGQMPTGYPTSTRTSFSTDNICIHEVQLGTFVNNSGCTGATAAAWPAANGLPASNPNAYANYTSATWVMPLITPSAAMALDIKVGNLTGSGWGWASGISVFIDYNRNGAFELPAERVANTTVTTPGVIGCTNTNRNFTFTSPTNMGTGQTLMRVVANDAVTPAPSGTYNWGETEDYKIFLGKRKWDYAMSAMTAPDSISFCAQAPVVIKTIVNNVENQPIPGGRVDLFIKSASPGGTTNLFYNKAFTQSIASGASVEVEFSPILFPKDELLEMKYVIVHPLDSNRSNDTLIKLVQVYKNPVYKLKSDTVCADTISTVQIYDKPLTLYHKWTNESILDTTNYRFDSSSMVGIQISRGWKCNVVDSVPVIIKPLPKLTMARDTVLCNGQSTQLFVNMDLPPKFATWNINLNNILSVNASGKYIATANATNGCKNTGFTNVTVVNPPAQARVLDTVCANEPATIGLDYIGTEYIYKWTGRSETTPLINPMPTIASGTEKYNVQWWYKGCTDKDSVVFKVNPLPVVTLNFPPPICPYFSSTIVASGPQTFEWKNGLGTGNTKTVSPMTTTDYYVKGTDNNGCSKEVMHRQFVYPTPNMRVYSNKFNDNICLGDSATIYVNGGKTYNWSTGVTDSIIVIIPTESFQWSMIGTDNNGCKDTLTYRMDVKPAFSISYDKTLKGCVDDTVTLRATGAKEYDWGNGPTTDNFNTVTLVNSTSYQVTATSPHDCQIVASIPVTVFKKPVGQVSDLTICQGKTGTLEAKGGVKYNWEINGQTSVSGTDKTSIFTGSNTERISVEVENEAGCKDIAWTTVNVINTSKLAMDIVFKSPLDSYNCASQKIPITLSATPVGGVWSGGGAVNGNKLTVPTTLGPITVMYTYLEPVNNCEVQRTKTVKFKCTSGILGLDKYDDFTVYPMPFSDKITVKYSSDKVEEASIHIYDLSGREVYNYTHRLLTGENLIDLRQLQLAKGSYYLDFQTESVSRQAKILAQ
jgi:hypothetical protein